MIQLSINSSTNHYRFCPTKPQTEVAKISFVFLSRNRGDYRQNEWPRPNVIRFISSEIWQIFIPIRVRSHFKHEMYGFDKDYYIRLISQRWNHQNIFHYGGILSRRKLLFHLPCLKFLDIILGFDEISALRFEPQVQVTPLLY